MASVDLGTSKPASEVLARVKEMGTIEVLPISSLKFDKNYQRDLRSHFAQKLAQNWEQAAMQLPTVSRRANGDLYVVNGQHRIAAATLIGLTEIVALVVSGLSATQEADLRLHTNVQLGETALERFQAKLAAHYPEAMELNEIVERFDTKINVVPQKHLGLNSISALEELYARDRGVTLVRTFEVIRDAWGKVSGEYATANLLKAVAWFIHAHDEDFNRERLVEMLRTHGPAALDRMMRNQRAVMGGSSWLNMYRAIVEVYNERLTEANRLKWNTRGWSASKVGGWDS